MRFDIRYHTRFTYDRPVQESYNELRACPLADDYQRLVAYRVAVSPSARVLSFADGWGTRVDAFGIRAPHRSLDVVAEATVETHPRPPMTAAPRLDAIGVEGFVEEHAEYLERTRHTEWDDDIAGAAASVVDAYGADLVGVVLAIHRRVRTTLQYDPDATEIGVPVTEVWRDRRGVCQDYAHLAVALCRSAGIPARYASGYLFSSADDRAEDDDADTVQVQTHAWFEAAIPGAGWLALDPTNGRDVGVRHVKIGHGRDYDDVCPFYGGHLGQAEAALDATVEIRRGDAMVTAPPGGPGPAERRRSGAWIPDWTLGVPVVDADEVHQQHQQQQQ